MGVADVLGIQDMEEEVSPYFPISRRNEPRLILQYTLLIRYSGNPRLNMAILDMSMVPRSNFVGSPNSSQMSLLM
jgi:hypothetical protein